MVDMASLDDLFEVAKKYETVVMEHVTREQTTYYVWDDGLMYRFTDSKTSAAED